MSTRSRTPKRHYAGGRNLLNRDLPTRINEASGQTEPGKYLRVNRLADLPAAVAGQIILPEEISTVVFGPDTIDLGENQLVLNGSTDVLGVSRAQFSLNSAHPDAAVLVNGGSSYMSRLRINASVGHGIRSDQAGLLTHEAVFASAFAVGKNAVFVEKTSGGLLFYSNSCLYNGSGGSIHMSTDGMSTTAQFRVREGYFLGGDALLSYAANSHIGLVTMSHCTFQGGDHAFSIPTTCDFTGGPVRFVQCDAISQVTAAFEAGTEGLGTNITATACTGIS